MKKLSSLVKQAVNQIIKPFTMLVGFFRNIGSSAKNWVTNRFKKSNNIDEQVESADENPKSVNQQIESDNKIAKATPTPKTIKNSNIKPNPKPAPKHNTRTRSMKDIAKNITSHSIDDQKRKSLDDIIGEQ